MSSGRDVWMESWTQEEKKQFIPAKTPLQRMYDLRDALKADIERIEYNIKEMEDEQKKTI